MKARLLPLLCLFLITGPAPADDRDNLGPFVPALKPPTVNLAQFLAPTDSPPVMEPITEIPYSTRRLWVDAEALLWWMRSANLPPLITASPAGTPRSQVGVLGAPGTAVLFGGPVNGDLATGGRVTAGYWFDDERTWAIEGYFFQLGAIASHASAGSPGNVGRPFFNASTGLPSSELVSFPGIVDGIVQAGASSGSLLGAGVLARANLYRDFTWSLDALIGYRYLSLSDSVSINENLTASDPTGTAVPLGTNILLADHFNTANYFHGGDLGLAGSWRRNAWTLEATARVALGSTLQRVDINGATAITVPAFPPVAAPGGFLALSSNSGNFSKNVFALVPETRFALAYDINARTRIHFGYSFLYWSRLARAGDQIDLAVNPGLLPPPLPGAAPLRPAFSFHETSFWAQGIDIGLVFRF